MCSRVTPNRRRPTECLVPPQTEITLRTTLGNLKTKLGTATPQEMADAGISRRLSGEGVFAKDGDLYTKKRHTFAKSDAAASK